MKRTICFTFALIACMLFSGCNNNLLAEIDKSLFTNVEYIYLGIELSSSGYRLSKQQKNTLRKSIKECNSIEEITSEDGDDEYNNSNIIIIIKKNNMSTMNLRYDIGSGYLYIEKDDIYQGNPERIMMNRELSKKYLEGYYKVKLSNGFQLLLNPLMKH